MKTRIALGLLAVFLAIHWNFGSAAEIPSGSPPKTMAIAELDKLAGQPVDIAPWAYAWRADRAVQEKPEAYFIPRRLDRIDKVYRTASTALPPTRAEKHLLRACPIC